MQTGRRSALVVLLVVACGRGATTTTVTTAPSTTSTTSSPSTTTTALPEGTYVLPVAAAAMPNIWSEVFLIPYGETPDTLGTSLAGDGEGFLLGPDYGAQGPDGTWWFLDGAKQRIAHFGGDGDYIDAVEVPIVLLVDELYFQFQLPRILDDGTLVANRLDVGTTILRLLDGEFETTLLDRQFIPRTDDGVLLYGFDIADTSTPLEVDPAAGIASETEWFKARNGNRFHIAAAPGQLTISLPDASPQVEHTLTFEADEVGGSAFLALEVASGEDGTLHLFILGFPERDESLQLAGYMTIASDGALGALEPMRDPFTTADPGSPSHLGVRPGASDPWIMFIDEDGVRVFGRS